MKRVPLLVVSCALALTGCSLSFRPAGSSVESSQASSATSRKDPPSSESSIQSSEDDSSDEDSSGLEDSTSTLISASSEASSSSSQSSSSSKTSSSSDSVPDTGIATPITEDFQKLFAPRSRITMSLHFSPASLKAISDYQSTSNGQFNDAYFPADLTVKLNQDSDPLEFPEVGVRMKGNTSRGQIVYNNGYTLEARHFKVSLKATFDGEEYDTYSQLRPFKKTWDDDAARKARKNRNLFGLEKFDLKYVPRNNTWANDPEQINECTNREIYCYNAFREAGLLAPYANIVDFTFDNGMGSKSGLLYELIEPIDKEFLKKRFSNSEAKGDLYKCVYNPMGKADLVREGAVEKEVVDNVTIGNRVARGKIGVENNYELYQPIYQLKTNDDNGEDSDFSKMVDYINAMWTLRYGDASQVDINDFLDVDSFLKFSAVSHLLGNFDDQFYNWNNYYIYFVPSTGKAIYIPYDWDWSLGLGAWYGVYEGPLTQTTLDGSSPSSVYYNTYLQEGAMQNQYLAYIQQLKTQVLNIGTYIDLVDDIGIGYEESYQVESYMENKLASLKA